MPVNSEGKDITYTSDEEIGYLMESHEKDYSVEFIGYLKTVFGRSHVIVNENETELFKCIITNGTQNLALLIWDSKIIKDLSTKLVPDMILHLDGCEGQIVTKKKYHGKDLINYELIIQPGTVVETIGFHVHNLPLQPTISTVEFINIPKATGEIRVRAYIKTVVAAAHNRSGPLGFGKGTVTEGIHKVPIRVTTFKADDSEKYTKGVCVEITGTVSRTDPLTLICQDISSLKLLVEEQPLDKDVVTKANKPLKRCVAPGKNDNTNAKNSAFQLKRSKFTS